MSLTKKQLQMRKHLVSASDVSTIFGLNQYKSPLRLYYEKTGQVEPDSFASDAAMMGHLKEKWIANHYKKLHPGVSLKTSKTIAKGHYGATPDRFVTRDGEQWLLECKATSKAYEWRSDVPERFKMQIQWQMMVTGLYRCDICADAGSLWYEYREDRDEDYIEALKSAVDKFWWHVKNKKAPGFLGLDDESKAIGLAYPKDDGGVLDMVGNTGLELTIKSLVEKQNKGSIIEKDVLQLKSSIKEFMGEARLLKVDGYEAVFGTVNRSGIVDWKAAFESLVQDQSDEQVEDLVSPFRKPASTYRSFKIKETRNK